MHSHRHLFERIATLENLIAAAHAALRGKRLRMPGAGFLADFEKEVFALHDEFGQAATGTAATTISRSTSRKNGWWPPRPFATAWCTMPSCG